MRFKLKTLLILTGVLAVGIAVLVRPYVEAVRERRALEELGKDWRILVGEEAFLNDWWQNADETTGHSLHWVYWPTEKFFGKENLKREHDLRIVGPKSNEVDLSELVALDNISHLEFNSSHYRLTAYDCECISQMDRLVGLELGCVADGGFEPWQKLRLKMLCLKGRDWSQQEFDAIGSIESLEVLQLVNKNYCVENLQSICKLKRLRQLSLTTTNFEGQIAGLSLLSRLPNLQVLHLSGNLNRSETAALASIARLNSLSVFGNEIDDEEIRKLASNKNLRSVSFGHLQISTATYDHFVKAGIDVEHDGLIDDKLDANYLQYRQIFYPLDLKGSEITVSIEPDTGSMAWSITAAASEKSRYNFDAVRPPQLELYAFASGESPSQLFGNEITVATEDWNDETGNFYDGIHQRVNDNRLRFVSQRGNRLGIVWHCKVGDSREDAVDCTVNGELPFTRVTIQNHDQKLNLTDAKEVAARYFDLSDFEEPAYWGNNDVQIRFVVKPKLP